VVVLALLLAGCGGGGGGTAASHHTDLSTCGSSSACYARALGEIVDGARDPSAAVDGIVSAAYAQQGYLLANCHGLMHTVGREYVARHHISLAKLMDYLPRSNDPACAAGYAHGLVTGMAPQIEAAGGAKAAVICKQSTTRMQRYSCVHGFGHAFMRLNNDDLKPALELCAQLGSASAPDCAQGAFHDYWFAAKGLDDAPSQPAVSPRALCANVARQFVRPCWYRAFIEAAKPVKPVAAPADIDALCGGLKGLQRQGCVTGAVMTGPADPRAELAICTGVRPADALSCIRGTKVTNMLGYDPRIYPILVGDCEHFPGTLSLQCDRWLGKAIGVITNGTFASSGCPLLATPAARQECTAGVKSMNGALVTFS
jgi:hypothetical protein